MPVHDWGLVDEVWDADPRDHVVGLVIDVVDGTCGVEPLVSGKEEEPEIQTWWRHGWRRGVRSGALTSPYIPFPGSRCRKTCLDLALLGKKKGARMYIHYV